VGGNVAAPGALLDGALAPGGGVDRGPCVGEEVGGGEAMPLLAPITTADVPESVPFCI